MNDFELAELNKQVKGLHQLLEVLMANCLEDKYEAEEDDTEEE